MKRIGRRSVLTIVAILGVAWISNAATAFAAELGVMDLSKEKVAEVQQFIQKEKERGGVDEISVYATDKEGNTTRIASTNLSIVGKPADPEDIDAIIDDKVVTISEGKILDVTVPIHNAKGEPAAVAGVKLEIGGRDKEAVGKEAEEVAKKIGVILNK
jgi:hypothetical protein